MEIFYFMIFSLAAGLASVLIFLYYLKKGQFEDLEETKYQMFWDENETE